MKNFLIILLIMNIFASHVYALARCRYDYDGNKVCKTVTPEEIRAAKAFRRVEMYDEKGRKIALYLKKYKNTTRIINSHKAYIGSGFEDYRGNVHIVQNGKIVKTFYTKKYRA